MGIGLILSCSAVASVLLKILEIVTDEGIGYWFVSESEIYKKNIPYNLEKQYETKEFKKIFQFDPDDVLIISLIIYGRRTSISTNEYQERMKKVTAKNIGDGELFVYVCDNELIEVYTQNDLLITDIISACTKYATNINTISEEQCTRKNWQIV